MSERSRLFYSNVPSREAAPDLIKKHPAVKEPADLKAWPWLALAGPQFGGSERVTLSAPRRAEQTFRIGFVRERQQRPRVRQQPVARLGQAHAVRVPAQERHTAILFQHPQTPAQAGLGHFQRPGSGRNAAALDDAHKGAEQREILERGHSPFE